MHYSAGGGGVVTRLGVRPSATGAAMRTPEFQDSSVI